MSTTPGTRGTIGIIGAGKSGVAIARLALAAGYTVKVASSGPTSETSLMVDIMSPGATAADITEVAESDLVLLAVPLRRFRELPLELFANRTVIDVMNYWPPIDGTLAEFEDSPHPSSLTVRNALPHSTRVVKTFNHLGYHQMEDLARPTGADDRVALGVASDSEVGAQVAMRFVDAVGFTPVFVGGLAQSVSLQPEMPLFGSALTRMQFEAQLDQSTRIESAAGGNTTQASVQKRSR